MNPIDRLSSLKLQVSQHTWAEIEQAMRDITALRSDRDLNALGVVAANHEAERQRKRADIAIADRDALAARLAEGEALLSEGVESAWCDAVIGCAAEIEPKRAAKFRDYFYDWQKRARSFLTPTGGAR